MERIREYISEQKLDFDTALTLVRASTVFTTHTPVPAGIDRFPVEMVQMYFGDDGKDGLLPEVPVGRVLAFGAEDDPSKFNMAHMGLRLAQRANRVSLLHGRVSRAMFDELWPGFDPAEVPIGSITNGVHGPTWAAPQWIELGRELAGSTGRCASQMSGRGCNRSTPVTSGGFVLSCARCWSKTCASGCAGRGWSAAPPRPNSAGLQRLSILMC